MIYSGFNLGSEESFHPNYIHNRELKSFCIQTKSKSGSRSHSAPRHEHSASCKISPLVVTSSRDSVGKFLLSQRCQLYFMHYKEAGCKERSNGSESYPVSDFVSSTVISFEAEITDNNVEIDSHYCMRIITEQS